jgi:hypothetical protein
MKGRGKRFWRRAKAPLLYPLPLPLLREGGKGDRLLNNLFMSLIFLLRLRGNTIRVMIKEEIG